MSVSAADVRLRLPVRLPAPQCARLEEASERMPEPPANFFVVMGGKRLAEGIEEGEHYATTLRVRIKLLLNC